MIFDKDGHRNPAESNQEISWKGIDKGWRYMVVFVTNFWGSGRNCVVSCPYCSHERACLKCGPYSRSQGHVCVFVKAGIRSLARAITEDPTTFPSGRGVVLNPARNSGILKPFLNGDSRLGLTISLKGLSWKPPDYIIDGRRPA